MCMFLCIFRGNLDRLNICPQHPLRVNGGGPSDESTKTEAPCHSRSGTIEIPPCSFNKGHKCRSIYIWHTCWERERERERESNGTIVIYEGYDHRRPHISLCLSVCLSVSLSLSLSLSLYIYIKALPLYYMYYILLLV